MPSTDHNRTLLPRLEREFPECCCLLGPVCPDGGAGLRIFHEGSGAVFTCQLDASRLEDARYVADLLIQVRIQFHLG